MGVLNRPAEVFLHGLQCTVDAIYIGRVNTSVAHTVGAARLKARLAMYK